MSGFAELVAATNFSFRRGASHPQEIVMRAGSLGLAAIGVADRNTLAGVVRAHAQAKKENIKLLVGSRLVTTDGFETVCYPTDRAAYARLCRLLTTGNCRAPKGECHLSFEEICGAQEGQIFIVMPPLAPDPAFAGRLAQLAASAPGRVYLGASFLYRGDERRRLGELAELAHAVAAPLVATNDVLYHEPQRQPLADVLTCIREKCTIAEAGFRLQANAERHLKSGEEMMRLFARYPEAVARTGAIAARIGFSLDELRYEYPEEPVPPGQTPQGYLEALTWEKAAERYPAGIPEKVQGLLRKELGLIRQLDYARYFLSVYDVVRHARSLEILCQGRGSAANSAVCYCLGITSVNPEEIEVLFERFLSAERREPPDIDVDFEHERREEVIQYLYERYGRDRAAICSTVIHYRPRMAVRDVGKAMGLKEDVTAALANTVWGNGGDEIPDSYIREAGLDPGNPQLRLAVDLARTLLGFPRHLSQHVGGFVLTRERLDETVPILNAAMEKRTIIEWDKDDIDELGLLKVDVLALGMLTCIRKAFGLIHRHYEKTLSLDMPPTDPAVYEMLSRADSIGVFQVESRAQMSMLPRLKPKKFYDVVIEVAIVRPGPIQGDMVHPYLRRRDKIDPVNFPSEELRGVLERTLGVPLFQEQAMQIAITAAGFSPDEANGLRKAMATFRHSGTIHLFRDKFIAGMVGRGYMPEFAARCFSQIEGFGEYGFPESHAASFALLVYVSAWIKHHYPAVFACALLNSQPMGFYAPAQIVRDARDHGVVVLPVDVNCSDWDCTLEPAADSHALRLGLRQVKGFAEADAGRLMKARGSGYPDPLALWRRSGLGGAALEMLANADAFRSMGLDRREVLWAVKGLPSAPLSLFAAAGEEEHDKEPAVALSRMKLGEHVIEDYRALQLSLKAHPMALLRQEMNALGYATSAGLAEIAHDRPARFAGIVLVRQRPGTASGVIFATLEDETGVANIIVWPRVFERWRRILMTARLLGVEGTLQREGLVTHIVADRLIDLTAHLHSLADGGEISTPLAQADHVKHAGVDSREKAAARRMRSRQPVFPSRDFH